MRLRPDFASARANLRHAKRKLEGGGAKSVVIEVSEDNGAAAPAPAAPARPVKPPLPKQKSALQFDVREFRVIVVVLSFCFLRPSHTHNGASRPPPPPPPACAAATCASD